MWINYFKSPRGKIKPILFPLSQKILLLGSLSSFYKNEWIGGFFPDAVSRFPINTPLAAETLMSVISDLMFSG